MIDVCPVLNKAIAVPVAESFTLNSAKPNGGGVGRSPGDGVSLHSNMIIVIVLN
jgi:hypothetical protein